jgi:hypothetical protein
LSPNPEPHPVWLTKAPMVTISQTRQFLVN